MIDTVPPAAIFIVGALIVPFLKGKLKSALMLLLPVLVFAVLLRMPEGKYWTLQILDYHLIFGRVDKLSMAFGYIFTIITFIGVLFALKVDDDLQHVSALGYAGGALGVTFAGDFFTLYIFWEVLAISSTFLILARRTKASQGAAYRYILVQVVGGLCLLAGIVIGTELSINGTVADAFCSILYTALLFMSAGAVLYGTGKIRCTDLSGLYRTMPLTTLFFMIGAASISGLPFLNGFISKSMVISAAAHEKLAIPWLLLMFVSAGTFLYVGIKVPVAAFLGKESPTQAKELPLNMRLAMGVAAFLCLLIGIFPGILYDLLPSPVHYIPYTAAHVVSQLQLIMFGALAFYLLRLYGYYPEGIKAINLDTDWFYRKGGRLFYRFVDKSLNGINTLSNRFLVRDLSAKLGQWSRVPVTSLVTLYMKVAGRDTYDIKQSTEGPSPETENLFPMGIPVFLSFIGLLFVLILFVVLV